MRPRTSKQYIVILFAAVLAAVVVLFPSITSEAIYPLEKAGRFFKVRVKSRLIGCMRGAAASVENERLKREVAALSVLRGDLERLESENVRLRAALSYADATHGNWIPAPVLSYGGGAAAVKNVLRVGKGALDGIVKDAVVVVPDGLVGLVTSVSPHTAEITLITDSSIKVDCEVEIVGSAPARGVLAGGGDALLRIRHLRTLVEAPPRSRVQTSGRGGVFPRGIEVGVFNGVCNDTGSLLREGDVVPSVDYQSLEDVFIHCAK